MDTGDLEREWSLIAVHKPGFLDHRRRALDLLPHRVLAVARCLASQQRADSDSDRDEHGNGRLQHRKTADARCGHITSATHVP